MNHSAAFPPILSFPREGGRESGLPLQTSPLRGEVGAPFGEPDATFAFPLPLGGEGQGEGGLASFFERRA